MFQYELRSLQQEAIEYASVEDIATGAHFPKVLVDTFCDNKPAFLLDIGCGPGGKTRLYTDSGFAVNAFDVNPSAVAFARDKYHLPVTFGDGTDLWRKHLFMQAYLEYHHGVLIQGVFANVLSMRDARIIVQCADIALRPGGFVFVAEPVRFDDPTVQVFIDSDRKKYQGLTLSQWRTRWCTRYENNRFAGYRDAFTVAKPGPRKEVNDWNLPDSTLFHFHDSPEFERLSRHIRVKRLHALFKSQGFFEIVCMPTVMVSRMGDPLVGTYMVYQKVYNTMNHGEPEYKFIPGIRGKTMAQCAEKHSSRVDYLFRNKDTALAYIQQLDDNLPPAFRNPEWKDEIMNMHTGLDDQAVR